MTKSIWADPKKKWDGFRLTRYWLDFDKVAGLKLTEERQTNGKSAKVPTTIGDIYKRLKDQRIIEVDAGILEVKVTTETGKESFAGPSFNHKMLSELLKLQSEGFSPFSAQWFFYDHDTCLTDPHEHCTFFVVCNDKIVREQVLFGDYPGNGFDPSVFQADDDYDSKPSWRNENSWTQAQIRFWYQKFYHDTQIGQLMLLRDDNPKLNIKISRSWSPEALFRIVTKIHTLLWVLIVIIGLILLRVWK